MAAFIREIRETLVPPPDSVHGILPPLLLALTFVTGLVDAFSYLALGHVFVANMTGNVVFLGFALAGVKGFSAVASLIAIAAFWCGALLSGRIGAPLAEQRRRLLGRAVVVEAGLIAAASIVVQLIGAPLSGPSRLVIIAVLASALGVQNAAARRLAVPDITTTVLTLTITGTGADSVLAGGDGKAAGRRWLVVATMLVGALVGALLVTRSHALWALVIALAVLAVVVVMNIRKGLPPPGGSPSRSSPLNLH
jgi:uncharacterized membrane protein YoaK (UPF0700 family)